VEAWAGGEGMQISENTCLTCVRSWVPRPALKKKKSATSSDCWNVDNNLFLTLSVSLAKYVKLYVYLFLCMYVGLFFAF
jgi:hypothetical protein